MYVTCNIFVNLRPDIPEQIFVPVILLVHVTMSLVSPGCLFTQPMAVTSDTRRGWERIHVNSHSNWVYLVSKEFSVSKSCLHCAEEKRGERSKTLEWEERISSFCCICLLNTVFVLVRGMLCLAAKVELRREILKVQTLLLAVEYQPSFGLIEQSNNVHHFLSPNNMMWAKSLEDSLKLWFL